jgi:hypothetical protein
VNNGLCGSLNDLAAALWAAGRENEAIELMETAATTATRVLSPHHELEHLLAENVEQMRRLTSGG